MSEIYAKENLIETENDGWQSLDWHDWHLATRDKNLLQYSEKQAKDAIDWYCRMTGEKIAGYERSKNLLDYDQETVEKIDKAIEAFKSHLDEESGLIGSEEFARRHMMYRSDFSEKEMEEIYKKWLKNENADNKKTIFEPSTRL
jgi:hypothetical protein